jgi:cytochrome c-type biogenesis protein
MELLTQNFREYISGAPLLAYAAAFLAGVITSFTPCVYPMIPITAGYIGGQSSGGTRMRSFMLSLSYVLGLSLMYSALGAAAALTGIIFGSWASNPFVYLGIAVFFIILGISMIDLIALPLPRFLTNLSPRKKGSGYIGAFMLGVVSSFVASPCTAPVMMTILTLVAKGRNIFYGVSLLFVFSLGLGLLLVVVGAFAGAVALLPKSGAWMDRVKKGFGIVIIACGLYFIVEALKIWF